MTTDQVHNMKYRICQCSIVLLIIFLLLIYFTEPWYSNSYWEASLDFIDVVFTGLGAVFTGLGVVVTGIICFLTYRSVKEVISSNKENRAYNLAKEQKDSFEKQFTILLQEHHNYLSKLLDSDNKLYRPDYLLSLKGFEALSIIRGEAKRITTSGYTFALKDDELLIKLNEWTDGENIYFFPSEQIIKDKNLTQISNHEFFISKCGSVYTISKYDTFHEIYSFPASAIESLVGKLERNFKMFGDEIIKTIKTSNVVSKNILSPYMRIVYNILKIVNHNTSNIKEMKQYTNIIRSIIPNDILILIAINAMFFYRNHTDKINGSYRWFDFSLDEKSIESQLTNDYYKYYNLLIKCDFFEHLAMDFENAIEEYNASTISPDFKHIDFRRIRETDSEPLSLILTYYLTDELLAIYKAMASATYSIKTNALIIAFYNGTKMSAKVAKKNKIIISEILSNKNNFKSEGKTKKNKSFFFLGSYVVKYKSGYRCINLGSDFVDKFTSGEFFYIVDFSDLDSKTVHSKRNIKSKIANASRYFKGIKFTKKI